MVSVTRKVLPYMGAHQKGTAMEVGSEDHRIANPAEESVA